MMTLTPYLAQFRISVKEQTRYFFSDSLIASFATLIHVCIVLLFYQATGASSFFATFTWAMLVWYIIMTQLIKGVQSDLVDKVSSDIQTGELATRMNKPYHYTLGLLATHLGFCMTHILSVLVFLIPLGLAIGGAAPISLLGIIALLIAATLSLILDFWLSLGIGMLALWTEDAKPYRWLYSKFVFILGGVIFPLEIFPKGLQAVAKVLPPAFMIYYPARLFIDFSWSLFATTMIGLIAWTIVGIVISLAIYKRGIRKVSINGG